MKMSPMNDAATIASAWFGAWSTACEEFNLLAIQTLLLPHGVWRDLLCLSWDFRSLNGHDAIQAFLLDDDRLKRAQMHDFQLDETSEFGPPFFYSIPGAPPEVQGIQLSFTMRISNPAGTAKGMARLMMDADGQWKALTCFTTLWDLAGHEETAGAPLGDPTLTWRQIRQAKVDKVESDPLVLIVGGAQNGLLTAARLGQMGIPSLVIEREAKVGDTWRKRYDTLKLHTSTRICSFLYEQYPSNFPRYLPKDRLADALEAYVKSQDLVVWTSSSIVGHPAYDFKDGKWAVSISRKGNIVELRPKHIVMATGFAGEANIPQWLGRDRYKGEVYHSSQCPPGSQFASKNVIVVGAGQSAADACMTLVKSGAEEITVVQRSATCVMSLPLVERNIYSLWPDARSVDASDFAANAFPSGLLCHLAAHGGTAADKAADKDMHDGLRAAGFSLTFGEEYGQGEIGMYGVLLNRFGGYWIDQGTARHIADRRIGVKQGTEVDRYDSDGLVFKDGTKIVADAVILATGYKGIRQAAEKIFGEEVIKCTSEVWGMDDEGEIHGMYRPTGHPGLWYAVGGFNHARFFSRHLGLQILAEELGLKA